MAKSSDYKIGDRVVRANTTGPAGTVYKVRVEKKNSSLLDGEKVESSNTIAVLWDNGTQSHFIPEGLERAK